MNIKKLLLIAFYCLVSSNIIFSSSSVPRSVFTTQELLNDVARYEGILSAVTPEIIDSRLQEEKIVDRAPLIALLVPLVQTMQIIVQGLHKNIRNLAEGLVSVEDVPVVLTAMQGYLDPLKRMGIEVLRQVAEQKRKERSARKFAEKLAQRSKDRLAGKSDLKKTLDKNAGRTSYLEGVHARRQAAFMKYRKEHSGLGKIHPVALSLQRPIEREISIDEDISSMADYSGLGPLINSLQELIIRAIKAYSA